MIVNLAGLVQRHIQGIKTIVQDQSRTPAHHPTIDHRHHRRSPPIVAADDRQHQAALVNIAVVIGAGTSIAVTTALSSSAVAASSTATVGPSLVPVTVTVAVAVSRSPHRGSSVDGVIDRQPGWSRSAPHSGHLKLSIRRRTPAHHPTIDHRHTAGAGLPIVAAVDQSALVAINIRRHWRRHINRGHHRAVFIRRRRVINRHRRTVIGPGHRYRRRRRIALAAPWIIGRWCRSIVNLAGLVQRHIQGI